MSFKNCHRPIYMLPNPITPKPAKKDARERGVKDKLLEKLNYLSQANPHFSPRAKQKYQQRREHMCLVTHTYTKIIYTTFAIREESLGTQNGVCSFHSR